ncbi:MAG: penicillin acylase family protein [Acidimicrobiia bacterium]
MATTERGDETYDVEIRWTTHGVAHVRAADWGSLGFGQGYCCARDNLATIADQIVKVRGERARFHGPGVEGAHLATDFGYRALGVVDRAPALRAAQPPTIREMVAGYVAGYNAWVAESRAAASLPAWCRDAEWIRPITELDLYAYLGDVAMLASGRNLAPLIGRAEAPGPDGPVPASPVTALGSDAASNGWVMGRDATASGHGMVLANPHFPWYGEARFWECHLTIPGELDVYGVSLLGTPGVQMGFNAGVGWAHTFSCGHRFTLYQLELVPGAPTQYRYGDEVRDLEPTTYTAGMLDGDAVREVERTLWASHHGPMVNLPLLGWGLETGYSYRDANTENMSVLEQFFRMDQARDLDEFRAAFAEVKGLPWVNTLAADRSGRVWYTDASATPRISAATQQRFAARVQDDLVAALLYEARVALLDGSDPADEWLDIPGARSPGLEPPDALPQLERTDFFVNANDSHWLPNPAEPLEGYSVLHGFERVAIRPRGRNNLALAGALAARGSVTLDDLVDTVFANHSFTADLLLDEVVARCRAAGRIVVEGHVADLARAADILAAWDRTVDLAAVGATLWRETMSSFAPAAWREHGALFAEPFDPDDPVATPCGLAACPSDGEDPVAHAVGHAMRVLAAAGVPIDAPLGEVQWAVRGSERIPVHGGGEAEGVMNILGPTGALSSASLEPPPPPLGSIPGRTERSGIGVGGYQVTYGTSFLMAVELTADGPRGVGLTAYGQSGDPTSPRHRDGTEAYAAKRVRPLLFTNADIEADPALERRRFSAPRCGAG